MKIINNGQRFLVFQWVSVLALLPVTVLAVDYPVDPSSANNGLLGIYSATFDPPLNPGCGPGKLTAAECAFFGGQTPATEEITIVPTPTGVTATADTSQCVQNFPTLPEVTPPCATLYASPTPSALDLTLSASNTQLAISGGDVFFPNLTIVISNGTASQTDVFAKGASIINLVPSPGTVPVDGNGIAVFEVDVAPGLAADFATFSQIVTSCTGPLCALIPILTLDMIRYRLTIDWDPTFTFFTANFIGQTANNSLVFATMDSGIPDIAVTDSVAPAGDQLVTFGSVTELSVADQTVTVTNEGEGNLEVGNIAQANPLAAPFSIQADACSLQSLAPAATCDLTVRFAPTATGPFSDSFDIPSDDPDENPVTVSLTGTGTALPVPDIAVTDSVAPAADQLIPFGNVAEATSVDQTVTIANSGNANLVLGQLGQANPLAAPFSIPPVSDNCSGQTIAPATNCTVTVRFAPVAAGAFADTFDIPSDDPDENPVTFNLTGTGTSTSMDVPDITVTDTVPPTGDLSIAFGGVTEGTPWDRVVTIRNDGAANLQMGMIAQTDTLSGAFSILSDNCSAQIIAPAGSCILMVRFLPPSVGDFSDSFDIPSNDADEAVLIFSVSGTGLLLGTGTINLNPEGADSGAFGSATGPATLWALLVLIATNRRRRR